MLDITKYKPNLIPNNPKDGSFTTEVRNAVIEKNGGIATYHIAFKKDGCRLGLGLAETPLTRSLKQPKSDLVLDRFQELNNLCKQLKIAIDGEFYMHGLKFNEIFRFFSNKDVTRPEYREKLHKEFKKDPEHFKDEYNGRDIDFMTTFHNELEFWLFDGIVLDRPDLVGFEERMEEIHNRLSSVYIDEYPIVLFDSTQTEKIDELYYLYETALEQGWEGLVITHKDHEYKYGRNSLKQGTLLKMKDDEREYDGIVIGVKESTVVKADAAKTTNELGRSVTSKKKADRVPSGMAKSFVVEFEGIGTFDVGLKGFNNEQKKEVLENQEEYIGRHFVYTGMKPVKDYPRHAYFSHWRDEK